MNPAEQLEFVLGVRFIEPLWSYWHRLARESRPPPKSRFDVVDLPADSWSRLILFDVLEGANSYRVRVMGTYLVEAYGSDFTGCLLVDSAIPRVTNSASYKLLPRVVESRAPQHYLGPCGFRLGPGFDDVAMVLLPLTDAGGRVAYAIGSIHYPSYREKHLWGV